jgi:phosphate-selective porin OprO/OprP
MRLCSLFGCVAMLGVMAATQGILAQQPFVVSDDAALYQRLDAAEARNQDLAARLHELESLLSDRQSIPRIQPASMNIDSLARRVESLESLAISAAEGDEWEDTHKQKFSGKWGGRIQMDYIGFANETPAGDYENYFEVRRMRFFVKGTGYGVFDYKLQVDLEEDEGGDGINMKDAYGGIHGVPVLGYVRLGHFKAPFSLEELTSSKHITFMERSLPNTFAPGREVGIAAYNHTANERAQWGYGVFFHDISEGSREREADGQGTVAAARATWTPTYDVSSGGRYMSHIGGNALYTWWNEDGLPVSFGSRPEIHEEVSGDFITTGDLTAAIGATEHYTMGLEGAWVRGPFSIQGEYMYTSVPGATAPGVQLHGMYVYASYFLTGESRGETYKRTSGVFDRVKPLENFWFVKTPDGPCVGMGALEAKIRWSYLDFTDAPTAAELNTLTVGMNWYLNPYMRFMFDWIHSEGVNTDRTSMDTLGVRAQVDF